MTTESTLLVIVGLALSQYSSRGLKQTLEPTDVTGNVRRSINGELIDLTHTQFQKYRSVISGGDADVPSFDNIWTGQEVVVDCVPELSYLTSLGSPGRTVVPASSRTDGAYTFYRPRMVMRIISWSVELDEWGDVLTWTLALEEV